MFIDLGGIDGLLHVTDLSWGRVNHPSEMFNVGDEITVKVLKYDREKERVSLGYKQLQAGSLDAGSGSVLPGRARHRQSREPYRLRRLCRTGAGVEGLIHVSEMSWSKRVKHPSKMLQLGQDVEAVVLDVDHGEPPDLARTQADRSRIRGRRWPNATRSIP